MNFIDEKKLPPHIFYETLKNKENLTELKNTVYKYSSVPVSTREYLKEFGAQLIRNYRSIFTDNRILSHEKGCRYLNYWVDNEICHYERQYHVSGFENYITQFVTEVWKQLGTEVDNPCKRDEYRFAINEINIKKDLDDFCTIRDIIRTKTKDDYTCKAVNGWVKEKYEKYFSRENCEKYNRMNVGYNKDFSPFHISNDCTFYDIPTTFRSFHCDNYIPEYKIKSISNCERNTLSGEKPKLGKFQDSLDNKFNISTGIGTLIASLTVLGTFFIFFMIYKFSPVGSFLRHNIMKRYKIQKNIDDATKEFLQNALHNVYKHSEEGTHFIGYNSV
ncbi:PIR Superfamily Protein [Plasmodium ovale wallikeri]|uniref:PIR protein n=2 Tax=Plasmodium ovale TaxID=36330 RepID=A0A1C3KKK0_PLAOA|nr:PIR Superfamily Protein [Plasmodium ovale wallikeri]SBT74490.1 PIR protein [Plasmodium ovale]